VGRASAGAADMQLRGVSIPQTLDKTASLATTSISSRWADGEIQPFRRRFELGTFTQSAERTSKNLPRSSKPARDAKRARFERQKIAISTQVAWTRRPLTCGKKPIEPIGANRGNQERAAFRQFSGVPAQPSIGALFFRFNSTQDARTTQVIALRFKRSGTTGARILLKEDDKSNSSDAYVKHVGKMFELLRGCVDQSHGSAAILKIENRAGRRLKLKNTDLATGQTYHI